jgi:hypothetical protein
MSAFGGRAEVDRRVLGNQPFSVPRHEHPATRKNLGRNRGSSDTFSVHLILRDLGGALRICRGGGFGVEVGAFHRAMLTGMNGCAAS